MSADFSKLIEHLHKSLYDHADQDGLTGVARALFLDRGGHSPGEVCLTAPPENPHNYWCQYPDEECDCIYH